ncbi:membrane protein [Kutzneria viridogrisea]|uniref:Uncharacterized protein n=2 Tax=Kutzneria TaxID=43356 RepID=W5WGP5_9PSEU|nr:hypothetical protein [Kutzneria albida]AHI00028.1 hypothetical protein KALB_6668 [Kutzneria albida DSM 43870]MBA8925207.1 biotin transporter BioY [Kutzneria viridogrisea]
MTMRRTAPLRRIDPGARAMVVAVCVLVLLVAALLPWVAGTSGWQVLFNPSAGIGMVPRLFAVCALLFGVLAGGLALTSRLWALAWISSAGCGFATITGLLAIWSQQSSASHQPGPGPGIGLLLAAVTVLVLTVQWVKITFNRQADPADRD